MITTLSTLTFSVVSSRSPLLPKLTSSTSGEGACEGAVRAGGGGRRDVEGSSTDVRDVATWRMRRVLLIAVAGGGLRAMSILLQFSLSEMAMYTIVCVHVLSYLHVVAHGHHQERVEETTGSGNKQEEPAG